MPTIRYTLEDGTAVTGTTTIIDEFKNPGPLLNWCYNIGFESGKNKQLKDLKMESDYDIRRQGTLLLGKLAYGHGILRPESAVEITTS